MQVERLTELSSAAKTVSDRNATAPPTSDVECAADDRLATEHQRSRRCQSAPNKLTGLAQGDTYAVDDAQERIRSERWRVELRRRASTMSAAVAGPGAAARPASKALSRI